MKPPKRIPRMSQKRLAAHGGTMPFSTITPKARTMPWRMCRTCHREGRRASFLHDQCNHLLHPVGECGQCGKRRPLVECHVYDFREKPKPRKAVKRVNSARRNREWLRAYGSAERVAFVAERSCVACKAAWQLQDGPSENAHTSGDGGMGRKASARFVIPLCHLHHREQHAIGAGSFAIQYQLNLKALAAECERDWQDYSNQRTT